MKRFRVRTVVSASIAAAVLVLSASPALAAGPAGRALPAGSAMYALSCYGPVDGQVFSVDVQTAAATTIGNGGSVDSNCAEQGAWDAVTHTAYYPAYTFATDSLVSVDLTTGVPTKIANFTQNGAPARVDSMAIGVDGAAYALSSGQLYSLNLSTAELTSIAAVSGPRLYGFAVDPTSGEFFAIDTIGLISSINVTTGALTTIGQTAFTPGSSSYAMQIDSDGTMWVEDDYLVGNGQGYLADLWSVNRADIGASGLLSGTIAQGGIDIFTNTLLIAPAVAPAILSGSPTASIVAGSAFSFTVAASGTAPIAFSITGGALPTGFTLDPATGVVSGTPTTAGSFSYTVTATNPAGTATASYTQVVTLATPTHSATSDIHLPVVSG
jgi:hypothetical protein